MSAPPFDPPATLSTSGYEDGLGRRLLRFDRASGTMLERLVLRPEFLPFEAVLRQAVAASASFTDERFARLNTVERDDDGRLTVVSELAGGDRLSDLIEARAEHPHEEDAAPGVDVALGFLLQVLPALGTLHATAGFPHGAVGPGRIVLRATGQPVLLDYVFGQALERLHLSRERLWSELRIAARASAGPSRLDAAVDIGQASLCALSIVIGRPLADADYPGGLAGLVAEVSEIAQIRGSALFASALRRYLEKTLPLPGSRPYRSVDEAQAALVSIVRDGIGIDACRDALASYVAETFVEPAAVAPVDIDAVPELTPSPVETIPDVIPEAATELETEIDITAALTDTEYSVVAEMVADEAPVYEMVTDVRVAATAAEGFVVCEAPAEEAEESLPVAIEGVDRQEPVVTEPAAPEIVVREPPVEEPVAHVEQPKAAPVESPRKRSGHKTKRDNLRSIAVPAIVTPPPPMPVFAQPPAGPRAPVMSAYAAAAQALWQPTPEGPLAVTQPAPVTTIRVKAKPVKRPDPAARPAWRGTIADVPQRSSSQMARKIAVAAIIVLVAAVAAGRAYLPERDRAAVAPRQMPTPAAPATAPAPAPTARTTPEAGSVVISTQPAGARVLLDGQMAGETPLTIDKVAAGRHTVTLMTASVSVRKSIRVEAGRSLTLDVPVYSGWVAVFAPITLEVSEGGRLIGTTEQGRLMLPPGRHDLTLSSREFGYTTVETVDITAGEERALTVEPRGTVNLNASPWAEVWIDGRKTGETPLANLLVPLGTREILFKHPQFGERRMTLVVTASSPAALSVDFTKSQ